MSTADQTPPPSPPPEGAVRDHLANERTLLAWQRTALALIGIGFLVDRFALDPAGPTIVGSVLGVVLVLGGAGVAVVGAYRFLRTEREIDTGSYRPAVLAHLVLAAVVVLGALVIAGFALLESPTG